MENLTNTPRWLVFSLISSALCIAGALCVPLMSFLFNGKHHGFTGNTKLVNYGLSLSAGSMLTTSLYMMLPKVDETNRYAVFGGVLSGVGVSLMLNYVVHAYASESLVHCAHGEEDEPEHTHRSRNNSHRHTHGSIESAASHSNNRQAVTSVGDYNFNDQHAHDNSDSASEVDPLLPTTNQYPQQTSKRKKSLIDLLTFRRSNSIGECCDIGECTPTLNPEDLHCAHRPSALSAQDIFMKPAHSVPDLNDDDDDTERTDNNMGTKTRDKAVSVACVENIVGYDLENLSVYRQNFYSGKSKHDLELDNASESRSTSDIHSLGVEPLDQQNAVTILGSEATTEPLHNSLSGTENDINRAVSHRTSQNHIHHHSQQHSMGRHHHHFETPFSKLLSIGMQTCLVLTLHKFPEGFIIFYTNKSKTPDSLGFSIFLSLAIHNFVEGFAMTLPLYAVFQHKWLSILVTVILGGGSQPTGALVGYLIFRRRPHHDESTVQMDFLLSLTAGFLLVIGLQMFQTGIGFSDGHHHHEGEETEEIKQNHSSGTTCLKFCCAGVLLILASQIFNAK
ncbi:Zn(2+) transporter ZRT3 KNAG_0C00970 [Huiozyma naganishii CBS 8797]|uniref:Zinc/iron permease n=1 Tax=Huiozyma naganishii (strain ATCC MYA-139 / BCRC 22969 / CBS 8797 / KCTC 17520 / NBRC 10181 / NCYC 3082 / Yp74L-3) TaxID=1071383 RepID=J7R301_HUIN7|nr:hypothetical protein KNAG_0C00970 [Kazachstania naganishii CBS 8797]CCK69210.1 hypothetical protein KNAG_0C00970 [Kazachstania naganishii CBS 8797]